MTERNELGVGRLETYILVEGDFRIGLQQRAIPFLEAVFSGDAPDFKWNGIYSEELVLTVPELAASLHERFLEEGFCVLGD